MTLEGVADLDRVGRREVVRADEEAVFFGDVLGTDDLYAEEYLEYPSEKIIGEPVKPIHLTDLSEDRNLFRRCGGAPGGNAGGEGYLKVEAARVGIDVDDLSGKV